MPDLPPLGLSIYLLICAAVAWRYVLVPVWRDTVKGWMERGERREVEVVRRE